MKKYLAITAALALVLTACGHAAPDSTPTLTAATETTQATAAPAEPPQGIGSGALRMLTAAADGVYYQAFNDWEINYTDTSRPETPTPFAACPAVPTTAPPAPHGATAT